ncbi:MAG: glycosyltransferase, partial [Anaerotignaceae bacterium]
RVGILTMFNGLSTTYSLVNVVADQIKMLLNANVEVTLLVTQHCKESEAFGVFKDSRIKWRKITNTHNGNDIVWRDYSKPYGEVHEEFYNEAQTIAEDFVKNLLDIDVCIMHDILYQGWHLVHNVAIRQAQKELPHVKFLAFTHSIPANKPIEVMPPFDARYSPMDNTKFVYPTYSGISALANQYNVAEGNCGVVYNSMPILELLHPSVNDICQKLDIYKPEYLIVYPARLTTGKRFEKVAILAGALKKKTEKNVQVIFCDFPSSDINSLTYKTMITASGINAGLDKDDIVFTSDLGYPDGFPRAGVLDLFTLSNLFICPSFSESFGLTVLEAASRGNFIVLNKKVPALKELGESINAYFMDWDGKNFGFDTWEKYSPSEFDYNQDHADKIACAMRENNVIQSKTKVRTRYNLNWIYKNQLQPLFF